MKKIMIVLSLVFFVFLSGCMTQSGSTSSESKLLQGKQVVIFGSDTFVKNSTSTLENLGATVKIAGDFKSAGKDITVPVEIHCIQPQQTTEIVIQASNINDVYPIFQCDMGAIFEDFHTTNNPDVSF